MADFPSKVTTETSSPQSQQGGNSLQGLAAQVKFMMDMSFIRSIPAFLMMAEIVRNKLFLLCSTLSSHDQIYVLVHLQTLSAFLSPSVLSGAGPFFPTPYINRGKKRVANIQFLFLERQSNFLKQRGSAVFWKHN